MMFIKKNVLIVCLLISSSFCNNLFATGSVIASILRGVRFSKLSPIETEIQKDVISVEKEIRKKEEQLKTASELEKTLLQGDILGLKSVLLTYQNDIYEEQIKEAEKRKQFHESMAHTLDKSADAYLLHGSGYKNEEVTDAFLVNGAQNIRDESHKEIEKENSKIFELRNQSNEISRRKKEINDEINNLGKKW